LPPSLAGGHRLQLRSDSDHPFPIVSIALITGAAGLIGSETCKRQGYDSTSGVVFKDTHTWQQYLQTTSFAGHTYFDKGNAQTQTH